MRFLSGVQGHVCTCACVRLCVGKGAGMWERFYVSSDQSVAKTIHEHSGNNDRSDISNNL